MFGLGDNTQTQNDDPAMLDNVAKLASQPADHVEPPQAPSMPQLTVPVPSSPQSQPITDPTTSQSDTTNDESAEPSDLHVAEPAFDFNETESTSVVADSAVAQPETPVEQIQIEGMPDFSSLDTKPATPDSENINKDPDEVDEVVVESDATPVSTQIHDTAFNTEVDKDHLAGMKQQALSHLEPLVGHLDQSPEETFKTTMMMIQANDNHTLIETALQAAKLIEDDNVRAQAMLDIINEINYFTQSQ